ncbi:MAG TPA: TraM recognition domain-containing protein [Acidimicrobiales bacterium]|nr:TraM recognition domain-containing protein [Acidimicrobiales bacterium]
MPRDPASQFGTPDHRDVGASHGRANHRLYVGEGAHGWSWTSPERSMLVLGPSRSGKTSSLVIPNILLAEGPVVSTSTKPDVMQATSPPRAHKGWNFLFDPSGEIECPPGVQRVGWSPLTTAHEWDAAVHTSFAMVHASRLVSSAGSRLSGQDHWSERAGALLAPLLHAAALEKYSVRSVIHWINRHDGATALQILSKTVGEDATPTDLLAGIVATDAREQSGIWSTASGVMAAYQSEAALASAELPPLDAHEFCRGSNTMFVCSAGRQQQQFAPLVVAALGDVRDATYDRTRRGESATPTLFALDEVANIAPLPDLPAVVSEGGGQGLLVMACLQDLSQARSRWGAAADGFVSLFATTVVLPGIADVSTLRNLSALAGEHEVATTTLGQSVGDRGRIRPSNSVSTVRLDRHPVDAISRGVPGHALMVTTEKEFLSVTLTPAHACSPWREQIGRVGPVLDREPPGRGR